MFYAAKRPSFKPKEVFEAHKIMNKYNDRNISQSAEDYLHESYDNSSEGPSTDEYILVPRNVFKQKRRPKSTPRKSNVTGSSLYPAPTPTLFHPVTTSVYPYHGYSYPYVPAYFYYTQPFVHPQNSFFLPPRSTQAVPVDRFVDTEVRPMTKQQRFIVDTPPRKYSFEDAQPYYQKPAKNYSSNTIQPIRFYEKGITSDNLMTDFSGDLWSHDERDSPRRPNTSRRGDKLLLAVNKVNRAAANLQKLSVDLNRNVESVLLSPN